MKFVFFGTPHVATETLAQLIATGYTPTLIVTNPDARAGRGNTLTPSPTKIFAHEHAIPCITPEKITDNVVTNIADTGAEYGICVAYGKILPQTLIDAFPRGIINIHYSLLPKYRGATPLEAALRAGDTVTGVTIQQMAFALDAGDILASAEEKIAPTDTARELRPRLITLGAQLLISILPVFERGDAPLTPQDEAQSTHCGKLTKENGLISLSMPQEELWNIYRAYTDSIGTHTFFMRGEKRIRVGISTAHRDKSGAFVIDTVKPEGKNDMSYDDFLRSDAVPIV